MYKFKAMINNKFIDTAAQLEIINPDGLEICGSVSALSKEQINHAFLAARQAQKKWEKISLDKRIEYLNGWKELLVANKNELATIIMSEVGKGYKDALVEVERTVEYMTETFAQATKLEPLKLDGSKYGAPNKQATFSRVAKGVGVAISPFNYPINLAISKIAPALVMGNTLVFKPATQGSLIGARLGELAVEAGIPEGIFNVVTGRGRDIGDVIVTNSEIDFISFTGSVGIGKHLLEIASSKDIVLELGGKDPAIVIDADNLEKYANEIVSGAFSYSGQRCTAIKRVLTTNEIADKLVPLLVSKINTLSVGKPIDNADITPLIDLKSADFVWDLINDAKAKGATALTGDSRIANLITPTLVDNVTTEMRLAWEEPFGPVLPILRLNSIEEMIKVANASNFGLQASIYGTNLEQALEIAYQIEAGTVNINGKSQRGPDQFPFLGIKDSGFGTQGIGETILSVTRYKGIVINH
ncbi:NADP-dependent glyceraldehyde-3-phosphate dehydrogenase [Mesoplasma syrphidae]|uniref:NADP-dependent glyceraldehyde-3-phosphate dehydrogenase n=1 Tax=Mesoplasma syrphidae TaxID=225999 RepID=A0A2K9BR22_9MOLU|nr:NADP-dependent glyceraldehyde-3-phosphate dehydrogenase [Mesoplasma syrphidae]AUF83452.1 NADP-dependent glyceraldehyde-3-phosphate dehydrogenase [Mesoplasma syrphidae]